MHRLVRPVLVKRVPLSPLQFPVLQTRVRMLVRPRTPPIAHLRPDLPQPMRPRKLLLQSKLRQATLRQEPPQLLKPARHKILVKGGPPQPEPLLLKATRLREPAVTPVPWLARAWPLHLRPWVSPHPKVQTGVRLQLPKFFTPAQQRVDPTLPLPF